MVTGIQDMTEREGKKRDLLYPRTVIAIMGHGRATGKGRQRGHSAGPQVRKLPTGLKRLFRSALALRTTRTLSLQINVSCLG